MEIINYKKKNNGCLMATFDVLFPKMGMILKSLAYMKKDSQRWVNMPSSKYEKDGVEKRIVYVYLEPERKKLFDKACFDKIDNGDFTNVEEGMFYEKPGSVESNT